MAFQMQADLWQPAFRQGLSPMPTKKFLGYSARRPITSGVPTKGSFLVELLVANLLVIHVPIL